MSKFENIGLISLSDDITGIIKSDMDNRLRSISETKDIIEKLNNFVKNYTDYDIDKYNKNIELQSDRFDFSFYINNALNKPKNNPGYIYIIKNNNLIKIGTTRNLKRRIKGIEYQIHSSVEIIYTSHLIYNAYSVENAIHRYFDRYSVGNEWFNCNFPKCMLDDVITVLNNIEEAIN